MVLLRFAPSPTGALHLGGLRTALYNYLYAKKHNGKWILRIEDTDATRFVPGAVDGIRQALAWTGLQYDYGPGKEGPHGPYYQSERLDLYRTYANKLLESGRAYRCFCSMDRLVETRERLARLGRIETYDKTCLHLTEEEANRRVRAGEKHVVRLNDGSVPARPPAADLVFGRPRDAHLSIATDPVLLKSDSFPTYHLASVVDDHEMGITHVLRGEEWLPSLTLHLDIYACLGLAPPNFAHLPLLVNPDGSKMSKRTGDVHVMEYMRRGWEPEALLNWVALAGWGAQHEPTSDSEPETAASTSSTPKTPQVQPAPDSTHVMTMNEMIEQFDLTALTHRSTSLDPSKLEYINRHHLQRLWSTPAGLDALAERVHIPIKDAFPHSQHTTPDNIKRAILALQGRLTNIQDIPLLVPYVFGEPDLQSDEAKSMLRSIPPETQKLTRDAVLDALSSAPASASPTFEGLDLSGILHQAHERLGVKQKAFMTVLRHDLSGMKNGPAVPDIMRALGRERTLARLRAADA